jgi:hypothetical protein
MDGILIFFLFLSFLLFLKGVLTFDIVFQLAGIALLAFLVYDYYFNEKTHKKYKNNPVNMLGIAGVLGNFDLILGILLFVWVITGIFSFVLTFIFAGFVLVKALIFIWGKDLASIADVFFTLAIFFSAGLVLPSVLLWVMAIYFTQKGVLSLLG